MLEPVSRQLRRVRSVAFRKGLLEAANWIEAALPLVKALERKVSDKDVIDIEVTLKIKCPDGTISEVTGYVIL